MHPRTIIRKAIVTALLNSTSAADRVYPTRKTHHLEGELPAIAVYTLSEDSEIVAAPRESERDLRVLVECIVTAGSDVDDAMDAMAEEIETVMDTDYTFGKICFGSYLASTEMDSVKEGRREVGILEMVYELKYHSDAFVAPTGADATTDYDTTTVQHNLEGNQAAEDQTSDSFAMEE